jgi:hypothetical protein
VSKLRRRGGESDRESAGLTDDERRLLRVQAREAVIDAVRVLGGSAHRTAILERALVDGNFTERQLQAPPPPSRRGIHRRLVDHDMAWALTDLKREGLLENPHPSIWRLPAEALAALKSMKPGSMSD